MLTRFEPRPTLKGSRLEKHAGLVVGDSVRPSPAMNVNEAEGDDIVQAARVPLGGDRLVADRFAGRREGCEWIVDIRSHHPPGATPSSIVRRSAPPSPKGTQLHPYGRSSGRPALGSEPLWPRGKISYHKVAATETFARGVDRLFEAAACQRVAILCSEEDPARCHRRLLVTPALRTHAVEILHIGGDGLVRPDTGYDEPFQGLLFS